MKHALARKPVPNNLVLALSNEQVFVII
jgi:hypothetical protein